MHSQGDSRVCILQEPTHRAVTLRMHLTYIRSPSSKYIIHGEMLDFIITCPQNYVSFINVMYTLLHNY